MTDFKRTALYTIARFIHIVIAIVFLIAALSKALDPPSFIDQIASYGILPGLAPFGAWFFIAVECLLAGMLIVNLYPRTAQVGAGGLLLLFSGVTAYAIATGSLENCGCFGNIMPRTPQETLVEDLVMLAGIIFAAIVTWKRQPKPTVPKFAVVMALGLAGILVGVFHKQLPVDDLSTQLKPGAEFTSWPTEGLYTNLNEGTHVVFLFNLQIENLETQVQRMNEIAQSEDVKSAIGLITDGPEQLTALMFQYGTGFPAGALEPRFARNLYRALPRTFVIHDGTVVETWSAIPDLADVKNVLATIE